MFLGWIGGAAASDAGVGSFSRWIWVLLMKGLYVL